MRSRFSRCSIFFFPQGKSSYATRQGTLVHSRLSSLSHCGLILLKEWTLCARADPDLKQKSRRGMILRTFPQSHRMRGKRHHHHRRRHREARIEPAKAPNCGKHWSMNVGFRTRWPLCRVRVPSNAAAALLHARDCESLPISTVCLSGY